MSKRMGLLEVEEPEEGEEMQFSAVVRDQVTPEKSQNEQPLLDFKRTLMDKLGGSNSKKNTLNDKD